jgi:hypothetical protein
MTLHEQSMYSVCLPAGRFKSASGFRRLPVLTVMFILYSGLITAQNQTKDTVSVIERLTRRNDSLVHNPDLTKPLGDEYHGQTRLLDSLYIPHNGNRFSRELNNLLQYLYTSTPNSKKVPVTNTDLMSYDGLIIRKIDIRNVNIFSRTVMDTSYVPENWLERAATTIHFSTREKLIRRSLLFQKTDRLDVFLAAENERLIRQLPYVMDARFLVKPVPGTADSVDIILVTKDLLPVGFSMALSSPKAGNAGIGYYNIFGYGHQLQTTAYWDGSHSPLFGYDFLYGIPNINGSFISSELEYMHRWNSKTSRVSISRDFKSLGIKYAGAIEFVNADLKQNIILVDTTLQNVAWKYTNYDFWLGRLFTLRRGNAKGISSGFYLAGRTYFNKNHEGLATSEHLYYMFQDKTQLLFSTGYTHRGFRKDNMIYTFDRVEDVPFGYMFEVTSGLEWGQYSTRPYVAANASFGKYLPRNAYIYGLIEYGTFINQESLEQGTIHVQLKGFSGLKTWGRFQYRNFGNLNYVNGINRFKDEYTRIENTGGIAGLTSPSLRGNEKLVLNFESVLFSPYRLLGFRFAFFGSLDLGFIKTENLHFFESTPYTGIGIGIRIRNEHLVFDTFELKFSFYPGMPADAHPGYIEAGSIPRLPSNGLFPDKPNVVAYN